MKRANKVKRYLFLIICAVLTAALAGCGKRSEEEELYKTDFIKNEDLHKNTYYVHDRSGFHAVSMEYASFKQGTFGTDRNRTLWYIDKFDSVPTLYEGDELVYYTEDELREFNFERFEYIGYSLGISGLEKTKTNRYSANTDRSTSTAICSASDAGKLYELGAKVAVIDTIGGKVLGSSNVSEGGVILGLKEGSRYKTEVYVGTQLHEYILSADTICLSHMANYSLTDYVYLQSNIIRINIPEWFRTGYYMIGGQGLFRYVKGSTYSDGTDFNVANIEPKGNATATPTVTPADDENKADQSSPNNTQASGSQTGSEDSQSASFVINEAGKYTITASPSETEKGGYADAVQIVGPDGAFYMTHIKDGRFIYTGELAKGVYTCHTVGDNVAKYNLTATLAR